MDNITLSKLQKEQYKEIKAMFAESNGIIDLSDDDSARLRDILMLLEGKGYIKSLNIDGANAYRSLCDFDSFDEWNKDQEREERKMSAREWKIAIISAIIGAVVGGLIPTFVEWLGGI